MLGKMVAGLGGCLGVFAALVIVLGISWVITCGIIYLITLCFALTFDWLVATGIWLVMILLSACFKSNNSSSK